MTAVILHLRLQDSIAPWNVPARIYVVPDQYSGTDNHSCRRQNKAKDPASSPFLFFLLETEALLFQTLLLFQTFPTQHFFALYALTAAAFPDFLFSAVLLPHALLPGYVRTPALFPLALFLFPGSSAAFLGLFFPADTILLQASLAARARSPVTRIQSPLFFCVQIGVVRTFKSHVPIDHPVILGIQVSLSVKRCLRCGRLFRQFIVRIHDRPVIPRELRSAHSAESGIILDCLSAISANFHRHCLSAPV